jgi:RNA polymerase sigma-70 factor (ECF subfamily)
MIQIEPASARVSDGAAYVDESALIARLKAGDEAAFDWLLRELGSSMLRVARLYVRTQAVAEEVVQDTWVRVLRSLDRFEGRSSLRTWIFVILGNVARTRAERESRSVPMASVEGAEPEPSVSHERFFPASHPRWAGMWSTLVDSWDGVPHERLLGGEAKEQLRKVVERLPPNYAAVFTLRDVEGWPADEVCTLLDLTPENQRVLLHRARARIRAALETYFEVETG